MGYKCVGVIAVVGAALVLGFAPLLFAHDRNFEGAAGLSGRSKSQFVKVGWEDDTTVVIKFTDRIIVPEEVPSYSQQFHVFVRKIGEKHTKIVLTVFKARVELVKQTLFSMFLKAAASENEVRERAGMNPLQVFLHLPIKSLHDENSLEDIEMLIVGLANYIENDGIVAGVVFETSLILNRIPAEGGVYGKKRNEALISTVVKFKTLLKSLQLSYGYELKMGLALNSYEECIACMVNDVGEILSSFDMVVLNTSFMPWYLRGAPNKEGKEVCFNNCVRQFHEKFKQLAIYHVERVFDFKN